MGGDGTGEFGLGGSCGGAGGGYGAAEASVSSLGPQRQCDLTPFA